MDVIRVRVVRVPSLNGLLGRKVALLVLRDRHQSSERVIFLHTHILNLFEELCKSGFLNSLKCQTLLPGIILRVTLIHVPHPKGGVSVNPLRNLNRVQTTGPRSLFGIHRLFDRQNVADRVAKFAGNLARRAVAVMIAGRLSIAIHTPLRAQGRTSRAITTAIGFDFAGGPEELPVVIESILRTIHN
jgi:hypothetical protein